MAGIPSKPFRDLRPPQSAGKAQSQPVTFPSLKERWRGESPLDAIDCADELESLEQQVRAAIDELTAVAQGLSHEQTEDPDQGMIPTMSCAHCQLLLTAVPKLKELLGGQ